MHLITLSFDDGFVRSTLRTAEIFEQRGLSACFNVVAAASLRIFPPGSGISEDAPVGDFALWNELQSRGHEIMPHGYQHARLSQLPFEQACDLVKRCLNVFTEHLSGFDAKAAVFNLPYNSSTPQLDAWLATMVRAFRVGGEPINAMPNPCMKRLTTAGFGPGNCEDHLDQQVQYLLDRPDGWLIYTLHGLDDEGWGPIRAEYLERRLDQWLNIPTVHILPTGKALRDLPGPGP